MGEVGQALSLAPAPGGLRAAVGDGVSYPGLEQLPLAAGAGRWAPSWTHQIAPCRPVVVGPAGCRTGDARDWDPQRSKSWSGKPFSVEAQVECSEPVDGDQLQAWAASAFERALFPEIATELYSGTVARAEDLTGNRWLTRSDDPVLPLDILAETPGGLAAAFGLLESYLACCVDGGHGVIHLPPALVSPAAEANLLLPPSTTGGRRYTWGGHVVVAECGYDGSEPGTAEAGPGDPDAGVLWVYASGPVIVRAAAGLDITSDEQVAAFIVENNDRPAIVGGLAMATWGCCHAAVPVDVSEWFEVNGS